MAIRKFPLLLLPSLTLLLPGSPLRAAQGVVESFRVDAAWTAPGQRLAPAYLVVRDGRILSISARPPRAKRAPRKLHGTLVPALVDAWSSLLPADVQASGARPAGFTLADSLPAGFPGEAPELAARATALHASGIAAGYLSPGGSVPQRGFGQTVLFGSGPAGGLPRAAGGVELDLAAGSARDRGVQALADASALDELFQAAQDYRDSVDAYRDQLEKYQRDLEAYRKKLDEYVQKQKAAKEKAEQESKATAEADEGKEGEKGKKDSGPPKRPKRPRKPLADAAQRQLLRALDGEIPVRVQANTVAEIRDALQLAQRYSLRLRIAGGLEADLVADELAAARVPVILPALAEHGPHPQPERALVRRYRTLVDAGVEVALASGGGDGSGALLLVRAGALVAEGADPDRVWDSLTRIPARLLGLETRRGTLRPGADAEFLLFTGRSPFDASADFHALAPADLR